MSTNNNGIRRVLGNTHQTPIALLLAASLLAACSDSNDQPSGVSFSLDDMPSTIAAPVTDEPVVDEPDDVDTSAMFVTRDGASLMLNGKPFRFQGSNNYYMHYRSDAMIDDVLQDAVDMNVTVLRVWGFLDGDSGHNTTMQPELGVYDIPEGVESGWERLDYTVKRAGELGVRLVIAFTNNWDDFGGMPKYVEWLGLDGHDDFYTNGEAKTAYKNYVSQLVNRVNSYTGVAYKDDPAIMTWQLANEPRAESDTSGQTLVQWAQEMADYVKSLDSNHLVALGSEGFFNRPDATHWAYNGHSGVDWEAVLALDSIDYGTIHLYPEHWGEESNVEGFGTQWIIDHMDAAAEIGKPAVLEEYGVTAGGKENRAFIYERWTNAVYDNDGAGSMFWILSGIDDGSNADAEGLYPDYDGFRIINDDSTASTLLREHGAMMAGADDSRSNKVYLVEPAKSREVSGMVTINAYPMAYSGDVETVTVSTSTGNSFIATASEDTGYYTAEWDTVLEPDDAMVTVTVTASIDGESYSDSTTVTIQNEFEWVELDSFNFDSNVDGWANHGEWQATFDETPVSYHTAGMMQLNGTWPGEADWEELRVSAPTVATLGQASRLAMDIYYPTDAFNAESDANQQVRPYVVLDPGWLKLGVDSVTGKLDSYDVVSIDGADYYHVPFNIRWDVASDKDSLYIGIVNNGLNYAGPVLIDNITLYGTQ